VEGDVVAAIAALLDAHGVGWVVIEDVLVHKLIAGRPRDLADIEDILASRPELDEAYVDRWVEYWDVGELWQQLRAR